MPRLPFDDIRQQADALLDKTLYAKNEEEAHKAYETYLAFLEGVGWDHASYEAELYKRVDEIIPPESWDEIKDPFRVNIPKDPTKKTLN